MSFDSADFKHYARTVVDYFGLADIAIRAADKADFARLAEIQVAALCASGRDLYGPVKIKRFVERHLRQTLALCRTPNFYVAETHAGVVGCGGWTRVRSGDNEVPCAVSFYVDPEHQRRGIGRSLLTLTETSARKSGIAWLTAFPPLHGADMFRATGYAASDVVPFDLGDDYSLDLLVMRKRLVG
ncbi:GNAT family N-acetyltransferase [Kaistia dalseonensis]|uniref:N-acetyltransferase YhbS n=1 Tax=Kaistia dalseonensis TaxID=410840 RepID=A0ABU0H1A5_9HYPH|nr:GNAT family N-acetyltransferase [Kaistia dalseonensis]MCX5493529.1 GNAT family N-acetyltransferase [Kaistia dalseonensis]MDQ0436089.1 putative N-acetyltransferase YhbS [Kaistia dalseonensis]